ncbi:hypothetical protein CMI47_05180 [Candidatus Pacearchaeota archaeon]|jgi:hypothetical protein|nr:hypothetical protein [Candidatus Pacearchaeota archaeon]|tara:strand:- start:10777 stop:11172 length:396 start_codon:yes stop_codon:yes gene_type:complete
MADLQSALFSRLTTALSGSIGTRAYWSKVPQGAAMPYLRMQTVSDPRPEHLGGYDESRITRVQVDVFSRSYAEARAISESIISAVAQPATVAGVKFGRTKAEGPRDLGEDVEGVGYVHRLSLDLLAEHSLA